MAEVAIGIYGSRAAGMALRTATSLVGRESPCLQLPDEIYISRIYIAYAIRVQAGKVIRRMRRILLGLFNSGSVPSVRFRSPLFFLKRRVRVAKRGVGVEKVDENRGLE